MTPLTIGETGQRLMDAFSLREAPLCVYGSDTIPPGGARAGDIGECIAETLYRVATGEMEAPVYVGHEPDKRFCRCFGGPAWFGYKGFDPRIHDLISGHKALKATRDISVKTYESAGRISQLGKYVVVDTCEHIGSADPGVKCIVCFGDGEQVRDMCGLIHFSSPDVFSPVTMPWGPACATFITYPAGMSDRAGEGAFLGPVDPSARQWLPKNMMGIGIPVKMVKEMVENINNSYVIK